MCDELLAVTQKLDLLAGRHGKESGQLLEGRLRAKWDRGTLEIELPRSSTAILVARLKKIYTTPSSVELALVFSISSCLDEARIRLVQGALQDAGIPSLVECDVFRGILVRREDWDAARAVIVRTIPRIGAWPDR